MKRYRRNPDHEPYDLKRAIDGYQNFHQFTPREIGALPGFRIPTTCEIVGNGIDIGYRSDKWENKNHDYIHDHSHGVKVARFGPGCRHPLPVFIQNVTSIYKLGACTTLSYTDPHGDVIDAWMPRARPELYAIPSGKALLIIDVTGNVAHLELALWGGKLDVKDVGIVG